jgi:hypothetical protein
VKRSLDELLAVFDHRVEAGVKAVGEAVVELAKASAPYKTGFLRRMIRSRISGRFEREVTSHAPYGAFVENGRGPVYAKPGGALRFVVNGQVIFRKSVGPAAPRPYMEPAARMAQGFAHTLMERALS